MSKIYQTNDFIIEVITKGAFIDDDPGFKSRYLVETTVFRVSPQALNEYLFSGVREVWESRIAELLEVDRNICSMKISQSLSEIFTMVTMHRIPKDDLSE